MSEYQYIAFRAVDAPVTASNLEFMRRQSSRAEITAWSFENEYNFGDFHGDTEGMLRRGYDFHLHYADFGIRKLMIRLPDGLPDAEAAKQYLEDDGVHFLKDKEGPGGILSIEPFIEPGDQDDLWELNGDFVDRLLPLRAEILDGDLRPLYLAHLAIASDGNHDREEEADAPVPAGLKKLTAAQRALMEFLGLGRALIAAAAKVSPPPPEHAKSGTDYAAWLERQPQATKTAWLCQLMADPHSAVRREILAEFQKSQVAPHWPTVRVERTIAELHAEAEGVGRELDRKEAEEAARQRARKLAQMAADPERIAREAEELVKQRSSYTYVEAAEMLADLREALAGTDRCGFAEVCARTLKETYPTLNHLTKELRSKGLLKK